MRTPGASSLADRARVLARRTGAGNGNRRWQLQDLRSKWRWLLALPALWMLWWLRAPVRRLEVMPGAAAADD